MVSTNTPVMLMYPCRTGSSVCAAAALIPPAPSPASFENTPREIPYPQGRRQQGNSRTHRSSRCRPERKHVCYRKQCPRKLSGVQTDYHSCPAQIKECHSRSHLRRFCNGTQSACHHEQQKNRQHQRAFFSCHAKRILHRQRNSACVLSHSEIPARRFRQKHSQHLRQPLPRKCSGQRHHRTAAVCSVFSLHPVLHRENSQKISKQVPQPPPASSIHPSAGPPSAIAEADSPRYCPSRSPPQVPSSAMRTARTSASVSPRCTSPHGRCCTKRKEQPSNGQRAKLDGQKNACPKQQKKKRRDPGGCIHRF